MAEYRYIISLRVSHPTMDLSLVSEALAMKPKVVRKAGEPRRTPKGAPLSGVNKSNFWTAELIDGRSEDKSLPDAISLSLDMVEAGAALFAEINSTGGDVEFFIGWFFDEGNSGDVLDHTLLGRVAAKGINLSFDVYR